MLLAAVVLLCGAGGIGTIHAGGAGHCDLRGRHSLGLVARYGELNGNYVVLVCWRRFGTGCICGCRHKNEQGKYSEITHLYTRYEV